MEFSLDRDALLKVLQACFGIVERKTTKLILANILIDVKADKTVTIVATDSEIEAIFTLEADSVKSIGKTTVSAKKLLEICRVMTPDSQMDFVFNSQKMKMKVSSVISRFILVCLDDSEFPNLKQPVSGGKIVLAQEQLLNMFKKVHFCMGHQDVRFYLNGLLLELVNQELRFVSTDSHRLAFAKVLLTQPSEINNLDKNSPDKSAINLIIPRKAVVELMKLLDQAPDSVTILFSSNHIQFKLPHITFTTKLLEGEYPDYNEIIPEKGSSELLACNESFKHALNSVSILANDQINGVLFDLKNNNEQMVLQTYNTAKEIAHTTLPVDFKGNDIKIGFNIRYLNDILGVLNSDQFLLSLEDDEDSVLVQQPEDNNCFYVLMPIRI